MQIYHIEGALFRFQWPLLYNLQGCWNQGAAASVMNKGKFEKINLPVTITNSFTGFTSGPTVARIHTARKSINLSHGINENHGKNRNG